MMQSEHPDVLKLFSFREGHSLAVRDAEVEMAKRKFKRLLKKRFDDVYGISIENIYEILEHSFKIRHWRDR